MSVHKLTPLNLVSARLGIIVTLLVAALALGIPGSARADPTPSNLRVFCFRITDIERVAGDPGNDRFRIEFEVLDWSSGDAFGVKIALNEGNGLGAVGGDPAPFFAGADIDSNGRPLVLLDVNGNGIINASDREDANRNGLLDPGEDKNGNGRLDNDPIPGNINPPNDWTVTSATPSAIEWGAGTPVSSIDLNRFPNGPPIQPGGPEIAFMRFTNLADPSSVITETIDNGPNVRDGFVIEVDDLDPGEILSFNWFLTDANGDVIGVVVESPPPSPDPFAYGVVNFTSLAPGGALPGPVFEGNTGFSQSPLMFFDSVYVVPNPASFAAEFGAAITAAFLDPADNLFNIPVTTHLAITVNTTADELNSDGDCSLREAITAANTDTAVDACIAGSGADTIGFSVTGTITLGSTLPNVIDHLTMIGPGAANLTISGNNAVGVLIVNAGISLNLRGLTIANGSSNGGPGGIFNNGGTLTVTETTISNNIGLDAAGIYNSAGTVEIVNSTLSGNVGDYFGGGIFNNKSGTVTIRNSTLADNRTSPFFSGWGGGIYNLGTLVVTNSTLSGNSVSCFGCIGGGIYNSGSATLTNSTLSGNSARDGGGILNQRGSVVTIINSTFSNNRASISGGGAISDYGGTTTLRNTIITNNSNAANCRVPVIDLGHNLEFPFRSCSGSILIADPLLGPLQNNGGPTLTHALLPGSPAIDAVPLADCSVVTDDQRGVARPQSLGCDIGAFELTTQLIVIKHVVNDNGGAAISGDFTMSVTGAASFPGDENGATVTLNAGDYSVDETGPTGYNMSLSADCTGTIAVGETKTCTVTNDDVAPTLTIVKTVVNDNGGNAMVADFPLFVNGNAVTSGVANTLSANTLYTATETNHSGYIASVWGGDCAPDGAITLNEGDNKTCTVTNDDIPPKLMVIKHVVNDNGGAAAAAGFTMNVTGTNVSPASFPGDEIGTTVLLDVGSYSVNESGPSGYTMSLSIDCVGTIAVGDTKTCTITNDDIQTQSPPDLVIAKSDGRDTAQAGDTLTYTLTISNVGAQTATSVMVTDTLPTHTTFVAASDGGSKSGRLVTWPTFDLAAGASVTRTLTIRVDNDVTSSAPRRDTRTWRRSGLSLTFSTPEHYSGCGSVTIATITNTATAAADGAHGPDPTPDNNRASDTDRVTASDVIFTTGVPNNWSLRGWVRVEYVVDTERILIREYQISQIGNLELRVSYPPVREWPVMTNGVAEIHVDLSISVYDNRGNLVKWVGGDRRRAPGTLGPGQDWDVWCRVSNLRN